MVKNEWFMKFHGSAPWNLVAITSVLLALALNQSQGGNYILQRWQRRGSSYHQCVDSGL